MHDLPAPDFTTVLSAASGEQVELSASWLQGRTAFGGLLAGLLVAHLRAKVGPERPLRSLMTSFVGPAGGGAAALSCEVLRAGGSTTQAQAWLRQDGELRTTCLALFGAARSGQPELGEPRVPEAPPPDGLPGMPYLPGLTPVFTRHFDYRWAIGCPPFLGGEHATIGGWIRFRQPPAELGPEALLALLDAWPVPVLSTFDRPAPASTITWHAQLFTDAPLPADGYLFYRGESSDGRDGYVDAHAELRTPAGELLLRTTQCAAVYRPQG